MIQVGIVGAGAMGAGIAQVAAAAGHKVLLFDQSEKALLTAEAQLKQTLEKLVEKGKISPEGAKALAHRIQYVEDLDLFKTCGLVIEAIIENLEIKKKVFSRLEQIVAQDAILASNTSSLSIAALASALQHKERMLGIHFFNPAPVMPLVEIIPGITTNPAVALAAKAIIDAWGKHTVVAKDTPGFIVNRVARPFYSEALKMYEEGFADMATIDWAMKTVGGFKMGPFELMDLIGHDVNYVVTETVWTQFYFDPRFKPSITQKRLLEAGWLGRKTGRGFYDYSPTAPTIAPTEDVELAQKIVRRILVLLINEAADALFLQVASAEDIDTAMTKGVNYPKGLLAWGASLGLASVVADLDALYSRYGDDRYRVCPLLRDAAQSGNGFLVS